MIAVVGCPRAGTTLVAEHLHSKGVLMCASSVSPFPGDHFQWEEKEIIDAVRTWVEGGGFDEPLFRVWYRKRIEHHAELHRNLMGVRTEWGVKGSALLLMRRDFERWARILGHKVRWICCKRPAEDGITDFRKNSMLTMLPSRRDVVLNNFALIARAIEMTIKCDIDHYDLILEHHESANSKLRRVDEWLDGIG